MFAIIDCNNFYASCERIFRPDLKNKPIIVLSNNDGCVVARSNESKRLGISMGIPFFKIRDFVKERHINVFFSNYSLYGNISKWIVGVVCKFASCVEIYSIDEVFVDLHYQRIKSYLKWGNELRYVINAWLGMSVSIGIAKTKTLAKIACNVAKKDKKYNGVYCLDKKEEITHILKRLPVSEIWGIGRRLGPKLLIEGVVTASDLIVRDENFIKSMLTVAGLRTVLELKGVSCISIAPLGKIRKSIVYSRSFGKRVTNLNLLEEAISSYASSACEILRKEVLVAGNMSVYLTTSKHATYRYSNMKNISLDPLTNDTGKIVNGSIKIIKDLFKTGYQYKKVGIYLWGIVPASSVRKELYSQDGLDSRRKLILNTIDKINAKWGVGSMGLLSSGTKKEWKMKNEMSSPRYTTRWDELCLVK